MLNLLIASALISSAASFQLRRAEPLMARILSPDSRPAASAGDGLESSVHCSVTFTGTQGETSATVVDTWLTPIPLSPKVSNTVPRMRFITGPPNMMIMRFQTGSW